MKKRVILFMISFLVLFPILILYAGAEEDTKKPIIIDERIRGYPNIDIGKAIGLEEDKILGEWIGLKKDDSGNIEVSLESTGQENRMPALKLKYNDKTYEYSALETVDVEGEKKEPLIKLNEKGEIIEAYFKTTKAGEYALGNEKIELPEGAEVFFKEGKAIIKLPNAEKIKAPVKINSDAKGGKFSFIFASPSNSYELENGVKLGGAINSVHYLDGKFGFSGTDVRLGELVIRGNGNTITYLDFDGVPAGLDKYDSAYISANWNTGKIAVGNNGNEEGPGIGFLHNKNNPFGIWIENTDHFAIQALGGYQGGSYVFIDNYGRASQDLAPLVKIMGNVMLNNDNKGVYVKDNQILARTHARVINGFNDLGGTSPVPLEIVIRGRGGSGEEVALSSGSAYVNGQVTRVENRFVFSNNNELGYGPDPGWIPGKPYQIKRNVALTKGISNRISYNYVQYTKQGFEKYTGLKLTMDSYSASRMTPEKFRMLIDWVNTLTPRSKKAVKQILLHHTATMGGRPALAWGGPGAIEMSMSQGALTPSLLLHEATHANVIGNSPFWREWGSVGGSGNTEAPSNFAETLYRDLSKTLRSSASTRGKVAVFAKYGIINQRLYDYHFASAGLAYGANTIDAYIRAARGGR